MGTFNGNILPAADGLDLGSDNQRWDVKVRNVDISGSTTMSGNFSGNAKTLNGIRFADQFTGNTVSAQIDAAIADIGSNTGLVVIPSTLGAGEPTSFPSNVSILDLRTGTSSSQLTNMQTGGNLYVRVFDNTNSNGTNNISPFSNAYIRSAAWLEGHAGDNNADQFFTLSSFVTVGDTPPNSSSNHADAKVAGYFAGRRDPGSATSSGVTGVNTNVDIVEDSAHGDFSIEADFNNGTGVNYSISTTSASKDGVVVASGGSNRPRWGFRTASTNDATNAWDGGAFIAGWYTKGLVVKPSVSATGTTGIESQCQGPTATSLATEQQAPYLVFTSNRWNDSTLQSVLDSWKIRGETIPHSAGTAGVSALYIYDTAGNKLVRYVNNSGSTEIVEIGGSSLIVNGQTALTSWSSTPGLRLTPADDTSPISSAFAITDSANSANKFLISKSGIVTLYNNVSTTGSGVPAQIATVDLTAQTAAIGTTTLYAVPTAGQYRLSWNAKVTTADGVSSTLGALTIVYTDPDGVAQTITAGAQKADGSIATTNAANTTSAVLLGLPILINAKASTNITYAMAYTSNTPGSMAYNLHMKLESLG